jgi:thiamine biosynthesis lipoprotein
VSAGAIVLAACRGSGGARPGEGEPPTVSEALETVATPAALEAPKEPERRVMTHERSCMGTRCTLAVFHHDAALVERAVDAAMREIERLDAMMTTWQPSSEVSRINSLAGSGEAVALSSETFEVLERSLWVARETNGAFDITVGAFKGLWKFDQDNDGTLPARAEVLGRLPLVDFRGLVLDSERHTARLARAGQSITLGGIAKGLIVDRAVAKLREAGLTDFLVQAGGDLYAAGRHGDRPWRVGIQDPRAGSPQGRGTDTSFAMLSLENAAFNTSGDYERFVIKDGRRYHHILDPKTGYPVTHTRSVTVLAPTSFLADTLDTAVFVLGAERGMRFVESQPGVEAVIVDAQNRVHVSRGLQGRLVNVRAPTDGL